MEKETAREYRQLLLKAKNELHDILREVNIQINKVLCKLDEEESKLLPRAVEERFNEEGAGERKKRTVHCSNCGGEGHTVKTCHKKDRDV